MRNYRLFKLMTPFRGLLLSAAYLMPFLIGKGLSQTDIFFAQAVFSVVSVIWEVPAGYLADRFGRARCIKIGVPLTAIAFMFYAVSNQLWHFVLIEILLAIADGLMSGVDTALLIDSLNNDGHGAHFKKYSMRLQTISFLATALAVPASMLLVHFAGIGTAIFVDATLMLVGSMIAFKLKEAPYRDTSNIGASMPQPTFKDVLRIFAKPQVAWMVVLSAAMATFSYMAFWLAPQYYAYLGIPVLAFSGILAARSLLSAWVAHNINPEHPIRSFSCATNKLLRRCKNQNNCSPQTASDKRRYGVLASYALIGTLSFFAMATGQWWLIMVIVGHDFVQVLHAPIVTEQVNAHFSPANRATLNSIMNLVRRFVFAIVGIVIGAVVDHSGLIVGLLSTGLLLSTLSLAAIWRLVKVKEPRPAREFAARLRQALA